MRWQVGVGFLCTAASAALVGVVASPEVWAVPAGAGQLVHPSSPGAPAASTSTTAGEHADAYADSGVLPFGAAAFYGSPASGSSLSSPVVGMASTTDGHGYWLDGADGGVFSYGDAGYYGSAGSIDLNAPVVGMAATKDGEGYWEVALDGGIFSFGDAQFHGSTGAIKLNEPIVGMAPTPDGGGYWLVAADGGIFSFGDAQFYGSTGSMTLNSPIVGMASTADGAGYWLVAADGGIFTFGDAQFYGSTGGRYLPSSVAGMVASPDGGGYTLAGSGGAIYTFGDAVDDGDNASVSPTQPIAGIAGLPGGDGYWLLEPDAFPTAFTHPGGGGSIVAAAAGQITGDPDSSSGDFCNPYGPCEPWCALFATWAWEAAGVPIPSYPFTGSIYSWAAAHGSVTSASAPSQPGDIILYGTGPSSTATSVHTGIIAQVWPDGAVVTIEGDAGPGAYGHYNVIMNGPFFPSDSLDYNGVGVYAIAHP